MQQRQIGSHPHRHTRPCYISNGWRHQEVNARTLEAPGESLHDLCADRWRTSYCDGVGVFQGDDGHDFIQPFIELILCDVKGRLFKIVDHGEARNWVTIEHVHDLGLLWLGTDHDCAMKEVSVPTLVSQPRAQDPAHDQ
jgi:hypothetical protein